MSLTKNKTDEPVLIRENPEAEILVLARKESIRFSCGTSNGTSRINFANKSQEVCKVYKKV